MLLDGPRRRKNAHVRAMPRLNLQRREEKWPQREAEQGRKKLPNKTRRLAGFCIAKRVMALVGGSGQRAADAAFCVRRSTQIRGSGRLGSRQWRGASGAAVFGDVCGPGPRRLARAHLARGPSHRPIGELNVARDPDSHNRGVHDGISAPSWQLIWVFF
eukprot:3041492-Pyramimonas_sp.AAC.1